MVTAEATNELTSAIDLLSLVQFRLQEHGYLEAVGQSLTSLNLAIDKLTQVRESLA